MDSNKPGDLPIYPRVKQEIKREPNTQDTTPLYYLQLSSWLRVKYKRNWYLCFVSQRALIIDPDDSAHLAQRIWQQFTEKCYELQHAPFLPPDATNEAFKLDESQVNETIRIINLCYLR